MFSAFRGILSHLKKPVNSHYQVNEKSAREQRTVSYQKQLNKLQPAMRSQQNRSMKKPLSRPSLTGTNPLTFTSSLAWKFNMQFKRYRDPSNCRIITGYSFNWRLGSLLWILSCSLARISIMFTLRFFFPLFTQKFVQRVCSKMKIISSAFLARAMKNKIHEKKNASLYL